MKIFFLNLIILTGCMQLLHAQVQPADSLMRKLAVAAEDTSKVLLLKNMGNSIAYQDPRQAKKYWQQGVLLGRKLNYNAGLAWCYNGLALGNAFVNDYDSALYYSDSAIKYTRLWPTNNRLALVYLNRSDYYVNSRNFRMGLLYADTAMRFAEQTGSHDRLGRIAHIVGGIYEQQQRYPLALEWYQKALFQYRAINDATMIAQLYSDQASVYAAEKTAAGQARAEKLYLECLRIADSVQDLNQISTYHTQLATLYIEQERWTLAERTALEALRYANQQQDQSQLSTAYARLSLIHQKLGHYELAIDEGQLSMDYAEEIGNRPYAMDAATSLAAAYADLGDKQQAYRYLHLSRQINDSMIGTQLNLETAVLQKDFEMARRDREIALLNKDAQLQRQQMSVQKSYLLAAAILVLLCATGIVLLVNQHRLSFTGAGHLASSNLSIHQRRTVYLVFKEALNNAVKYSGTHRVDIVIEATSRQLVLRVMDHGSGFVQGQGETDGNGLANMKTRAREIGGTLAIRSVPGEGTAVELRFQPKKRSGVD